MGYFRSKFTNNIMPRFIKEDKIRLFIKLSKIHIKREITYLKLVLFKSSLPISTQLIWSIFSSLTRLKNFKQKSKNIRKKFLRNGYADIGLVSESETLEIKKLINPFLEINDKPFKSLPRLNNDQVNDQLAKRIYKFLKDFKPEIYSIMGSDFQSFLIDVQKTIPSEEFDQDSSFAWHYDDEPSQMIKVFLYLTDTTKTNGAFRTFNRKISRNLFSNKFISNTRDDRIRSQNLVSNDIEKESTWIERKSGSLFCFDNSLIHKATYPVQGERIIISIMLYPSFSEINIDNIKKSLSMDLSSYNFPPNPWKNPYS